MSWVIKEKATDRIVCEVFSIKAVKSFDPEIYRALHIKEHLASLNNPKETNK